jgi:ETC complex I subunit conserved region
MLQSVKSAEERWMDRVGVSPVPPTPSVFPADVVAIIYKPARSAMTSGKARTRQWKLRFEPRSPQFISH